jgi:hypothetical protein
MPARDQAEEDAGIENPRQRTRTRSPFASPMLRLTRVHRARRQTRFRFGALGRGHLPAATPHLKAARRGVPIA